MEEELAPCCQAKCIGASIKSTGIELFLKEIWPLFYYYFSVPIPSDLTISFNYFNIPFLNKCFKTEFLSRTKIRKRERVYLGLAHLLLATLLLFLPILCLQLPQPTSKLFILLLDFEAWNVQDSQFPIKEKDHVHTCSWVLIQFWAVSKLFFLPHLTCGLD